MAAISSVSGAATASVPRKTSAFLPHHNRAATTFHVARSHRSGSGSGSDIGAPFRLLASKHSHHYHAFQAAAVRLPRRSSPLLARASSPGSSSSSGDDLTPTESAKREAVPLETKGMSMSQMITLAYGLLVGVGGIMGYLKAGSAKSLVSGLLSGAVLTHVYNQLPVSPIYASVLGFGVSLTFLIVMGSRFKTTGKIFPAGVITLSSLIMTVGYIHGMFKGKRHK